LAQAFAECARVRLAGPPGAIPADHRPSVLTIPFTPEATREELSAACLRAFSLEAVFARDLASAHRDGLLTIEGLEAPFEMAGCVLEPASSAVEAVMEARQHASCLVAIDAPEYGLTRRRAAAPAYARVLATALRCVGLPAVVNVNCKLSPPWADEFVFGPPF